MIMEDLLRIVFLVFLEGLLSFDNAIVLALLVKHLPKEEQNKALTCGIWCAFLFRFISLFLLSYLMQNTWIKLLGGLYLLKLSYSYFFGKKDDYEKEINEAQNLAAKNFWMTILGVELMDIAFSIDSIFAAIAVTPKLPLVFIGGVLGIIMMRFAATLFIKFLEKFPKLETSAYLLVAVIGMKLIAQASHIHNLDFESTESPAFWLFWGSLLLGLGYGFLPNRNKAATT